MQGPKGLQKRLAWVISTVLIVALIGGCGSSDGEDASASAPLTKKEFVKKGNSLCDAVLGERDNQIVKAYKKHVAEYERLPKAGQERLVGEVALEVDLPLYRKLIHELGELTPPAKDQKTVDQLLSNYEALLDRLFEHPEELHELEPLAPNKEATAYGLISCSL
jgi:hypothetical protein